MEPDNFSLGADHQDWMLQSDQVSDLMLAETLVQLYGDNIYQLALASCCNSSQALTLSIEMIASAVSQRHLFVGQLSLKAWLISIALKKAAALPGTDDLILLLHYGQELPILEIASVLNTDPQQVVDSLHTHRNTASIRAELDCLFYRSQSEAEIDGWPASKDRSAWTEHLVSCADCRLYRHYLSLQEDRLKKAYYKEGLPIQLDDQSRSRITSRVHARVSQARKRFSFILPLKEILLTSLMIILLIAFAWSTNLFDAKLDPNTLPVIYKTKVVTSNVIVMVTPTPAQTFYYRVKPGDTLASIASGTGAPIELIASKNNLKVDSALSPGQLLILPDTVAASAGFSMPTRVSPFPIPQILPAQADLASIRQRISESSNMWNTLWADVRLISYGPTGYIGPPVMDLHKQVWISKPSHSLVISGPSNGNTGALGYVEDGKISLTDGQHDFVDNGTSVRLVDDLALRSLFFDPFLSAGESLSGTVKSMVGYVKIAGQDALMLDWYNQNNIRQSRFWVDRERGVILGQRRYDGTDGQTVLWDEFITSIVFDVNFPQGFFEHGAYAPLAFAQDYTGRPAVWIEPEPVPDWFPKADRSLLVENPSPPGFDPSKSIFTFQWPQLDSPSTAIKLFGDQYYLGKIDAGRSIPLPGDWVSRDVSSFIDWLPALEPPSSQWWNTFYCRRSTNGRLLVFRPDMNMMLYWLDPLSPQQTNKLIVNSRCGGDFAINPDNKRVAFIGDVLDENPCRVSILDTFTGGVARLLDIPKPDSLGAFYADSLTWSPDGSQLAMLLHYYEQTGEEVYTLNYEKVLVGAADTGEIIYTASFDSKSKRLPADAPILTWGVPFPTDPARINNCIEP